MTADRQQRSLIAMTTAVSSLPARRRAAAPGVTLAGALLVALAGCTTSTEETLVTGGIPDDYRHNHPIAVEEMVQTMDVPVGQSSAKLTTPVQANVVGFAQRFIASGSAPIVVVAPSGSPNQAAAANLAVQVEDTLRRAGVNPRSIEYRVYRAGPEERNAPIRIAFNGMVAHAAPCGPWPDQVVDSPQNREYAAFGCATQQNLAAMVQNPLDLIYPRGLAPPDAVRRATALDGYRKGSTYISSPSNSIGGQVATGVGQ
jgi:pilus assembly protein CpaD